MQKTIPCFALILSLLSPGATAAPKPLHMADYVTCSVYFRMIAGSLEANAGQDNYLADVAKDKMSELADRAREAAAKEFGREDGEGKFDAAWKVTLKKMTDVINRNYVNTTRLRVLYGDRCDAMYKKVDQEEGP